MSGKGMTARICAFSRAYHAKHNTVKIFDDTMAEKLLTKEEYITISENMSQGIAYFNRTFAGTSEEALRWVVDNQLSQTPLARAAFTEASLKEAVEQGTTQYLIFAAGYDTFAYRQPEWAKGLSIYEIDYPSTSEDKVNRLAAGKIPVPANVHFVQADFSKMNWQKALEDTPAYKKENVSFCSMLGIIYYLSKETFEEYMDVISRLACKGSSIIFDYPNEQYFKGQKKHLELANAAKETMQACYSYSQMKSLLARYGFEIKDHLDASGMTKRYFSEYNKANPDHVMVAQKNVNYCLAVKNR
ncbi:MAG: class I SAM-dependent methyltransferase [bacterium]|nr:class I SAM-dependent methyltransferase [bacterium]